jgi:hypothetical protein
MGSKVKRIWRDEHYVALQIGNQSQAFDHRATALYDLTTCDDRIVAAYLAEAGETLLIEATDMGGPQVTMVREVPAGTRRIAVTKSRWYVASEREVHVFPTRFAEPELLSLDPVDLAASDSAVCVLAPRGATWFDHDARVLHRRLLASPSAVAYDRLSDTWLIAADGDVLQLAAPSAEPVVLVRGIGLASRVRRDVDTLYASVAGVLHEARGIRNGPTTNAPTAIATFRPGEQFDAYDRLFIGTSVGAGPFYAEPPCKCRVRPWEVVSLRSESFPDSSDWCEVFRCSRCGHEWTVHYTR